MSDDVEGFLEETRWQGMMAAASPVVRAWCERFLRGATLNPHANIYEREGYGLARLAPERFKKEMTHADDETTH